MTGRLDNAAAAARAERRGWFQGYRAALADLARLASSRGIAAAGLDDLLATMREDAEEAVRDMPDEIVPAAREKLKADRLSAIAAMVKRGMTVREIAARLHLGKSQVDRLIAETRAAGRVPFLSPRGQKRDSGTASASPVDDGSDDDADPTAG